MENKPWAQNIVPIVGLGSPVLREICHPITNGTDNNEAIEIAFALKATLDPLRYRCGGLAAPQINKPLRMFIMNPVVDVQEPYIVINPTIVKRRMKVSWSEGCMSIPDIYSDLKVRDDIIDVEYYNEQGKTVKKRLRGFESVVFQHEYDHLNGILFIDHLTEQGREKIAERLKYIEEGKVKTYYDMIFPGTNVPPIITKP